MESTNYKKIMIATDGSVLGKKAIEYGVEIARLSGAKLYAVNVVSAGGHHLIPPRDAGWENAMKEQLKTEGIEATSYVEKAGTDAGVETEAVILEGHPVEEIVKFSEENDIDLVVMGTLGKTGINKFLLGSVAEKVIRNSKKAVLVVRGEKGEKA
ncbi:MAG: universal stress protein [Methanosarcinaceae archaeon]|nr:universal stress protein [Methanosarcinaceae archaeon]MDD4498729.1 universal stress protein [Methanosarcinaceae archaeon]